MNESSSQDWGEELSWQDIETVDRLGAEYRSHMRRQVGRVARHRPVEEIALDFRSVLSWLLVEDVESVNDRDVKNSDEIYLDYSSYDIEDTFFIVYDELNGRRSVRVEDIIREHEETSLRAWQEQQTKEAASFLIIHGADENEINEWKSVEGTARQQRAMRRMYWLLQQPFMQQFKDFLRARATTEHPYSFSSLGSTVEGILEEGYQNAMAQAENKAGMIPRKQEELEETIIWVQRALNICVNVFNKDTDDNVYVTKISKG